MKKTLNCLLVLSLGLSACDKNDIKEVSELPVQTTMTRTIHFTITGANKDTAYTLSDKIITEAGFSNFSSGTEKNTFYLYFNAGPHVDNTVGDFIHFQVDKAKLKEGYIGSYSLNAPANPLQNIRYVYTVRDARGGTSGSISDYGMGLGMQGDLTIEKYDAVRKTITGSFEMTAALNDDPTTFNIGYRPDEQCTLKVAGTFSNVKIKQD